MGAYSIQKREPMPQTQTVDVSRLIHERKINGFNIPAHSDDIEAVQLDAPA